MPPIVPNSVYLSHQFTFDALAGGDYYALFRRGDLAVPVEGVKVRKEVRPGSVFSPRNAIDDSETFVSSLASALIAISGGAPPGFGGCYDGLAPLAGSGSLGGRNVPKFGTSSSSIHGHGVRNSFDEGLASAVSTNFSPVASPSRRVFPALPNGIPTTQIRHQKHGPRALVDVGTIVVKELGRLERGPPARSKRAPEVPA